MSIAHLLFKILVLLALWASSFSTFSAQISVASTGNNEVMWVSCAAAATDATLRIQHSGSIPSEDLVLSRNNHLIKHLISGVGDPCGHDNWRNFPAPEIQALVESLGNRGALAAWQDGSTLFILVSDTAGLTLYAADDSAVYPSQRLLLAERPFALHFTETRWQEAHNRGGALRAFGEAGYLIEISGKLILKRYADSDDRFFVGNSSDPVTPPPWYNTGGPIRFPIAASPLEAFVAAAVLSPEARESASGTSGPSTVALPLPQNPIVFLRSTP